MDERYVDLILALAEGRLSPEEAAAAEAELASHPEAAADLAAQRDARDAVRSAVIQPMTNTERDDLRAELRRRLHLEAPAPPIRRRSWLVRLAPAFGAAAVVALAVVSISTLRPADDGADVAMATSTSVAAAAEAEAPAFAGSPAATQAPAPGAADLDVIDDRALEELLAAVSTGESGSTADSTNRIAGEMPSGDISTESATDAADDGSADSAACLAEAGDRGGQDAVVTWLGRGSYEGVGVAVILVDPAVGPPRLHVYDLSSCALVRTVGP